MAAMAAAMAMAKAGFRRHWGIVVVAASCEFPVSRKCGEDSQISQDSSNSSDSQVDFVNLANLWVGSGDKYQLVMCDGRNILRPYKIG